MGFSDHCDVKRMFDDVLYTNDIYYNVLPSTFNQLQNRVFPVSIRNKLFSGFRFSEYYSYDGCDEAYTTKVTVTEMNYKEVLKFIHVPEYLFR